MKLTVIDPTTGKALGMTRLRREIVPGYLGTLARPGTRLGKAVLRTPDWGVTAADIRHVFGRLVWFVDMSGWVIRVEATKRERNAIHVPQGKRGLAWAGGQTVIRPGAEFITPKERA